MGKYIHQLKDWPAFKWEQNQLLDPLSNVRHKQGRLLGRLEGFGFRLREEATLETLTEEVVKSSEIEGEALPVDQVRSSIARRLGIEMAGEVPANRHIEGVVDMMLNATQHYSEPLNDERLFGWHASLFPTGRSGAHKIKVAAWREDVTGPMQVVSGPMGKERVHYEAPIATRLSGEMGTFLNWFNAPAKTDPMLKAAIAHLWFVTIHPFDDGNGRIARAVTEMQLSRADESRQRFYSMSAQIQRERNAYYTVLEKTQKGNLNITSWLVWFLDCLNKAIAMAEEKLSGVILKAKFWEARQGTSLNERQLKMINKILDGIEGKLTSSKWAKMTKCSPDTALRDIQDLITKGILEKEPAGGRSTRYHIKY